MTIKSDCNAECTEYAFLNIKNSLFSFPTANLLSITFINLIIDREIIDSPYLIYATDRENFSYNCPQVDFLNLIEITPKAMFYVENVTFQNIRYNIRSIISAEDCRLELYNTNFININVFYCPDNFAVIMLACNNSCLGSSFTYKSGNVCLSNGYFNKYMSFGSSFLASEGFKNLKIFDIEFWNITVLGDWGLSDFYFNHCKSIFCIYDCKQAVITNNSFNYIYSESDMIFTSTDSAYLDWTATVRIDNNQFFNVWISNSLIDIRSEIAYILIKNLIISQSLFDSSLIALIGEITGADATIENIWIENSSFYTMIVSNKTKILKISSLYTTDLISEISTFIYNQALAHYNDINQLKAKNNNDWHYINYFIDSKYSDILISNIKIDKNSFFDDYIDLSGFASIEYSHNFLLENIQFDELGADVDGCIHIGNSVQGSFRNLTLSNTMLHTEARTIIILNCWNTTIFSSYFNTSSIEVFAQTHMNGAIFKIYDIIFEKSVVGIYAYSERSNYQFINCSFYNTDDWVNDGLIFANLLGEEHLIITKNCLFKFNQWHLFYLEGGNYQDFNSVFQRNAQILITHETWYSISSYLFNNSKFYDNAIFFSAFKVNLGILKFVNCTFLRNGGIQAQSSVFIEDSTFINNTVFWNSFLVTEGNQSSIKNSYFENNYAVNTLNSSSFSIEIYNSVFVAKINGVLDSFISIKGEGEISILNTNFINDYSQIIIYSEGDRTAKIENSYFNIVQPYFLGSISFIGGSIHISNITIKGSHDLLEQIYFDSAFIYVNKADILDIKDSKFDRSFYNAIYLNNTNSIRIAQSLFKNGVQSRALEIGYHFECYLTNLQFFNNSNSTSGGSILLTNTWKNSYTIIDNCEFYRNKADTFGGAIVIDGCGTTIKNSRFINNTSWFGGAIVSACFTENSNNYLTNNTFFTNKAQVGGAVYWEKNYLNISNNTFIDNFAEYGNNTASYPIKLEIIKQPYNVWDESGKIENYLECSLDRTISFELALIDSDNQIVSYGYSYPMALNYYPAFFTMVGSFEMRYESGIIFFSGLKFLCKPGSQIMINLSYFEEMNYYFHKGLSFIIPNISVILQILDCKIGEHRDKDRCEYCAEGSFSLDPNEDCEACPNNAYCYGGNQIAPFEGFWHGNINSSEIYSCPNSHACRGGVNNTHSYWSLIGLCNEGYRGNLCQPCDFNYSSSGRNECEKCPTDQGSNAAKIIGILIAACISLTLIAYFSLKTAYEPKSTISVYCRILINYLQMITFIARLKLNWPFYIDFWIKNQGYPGEIPTHIVSIDCYLMDKSDQDSYKTIYFKKMIMIAILPLILGIATFIFWSFISIFKRNWKMMKNELIATLCILLFLLLPSITDYMFSIYSCTYIYGELFLVSNLDIKCWNGEHLFYALAIALPGIIVWTIGIPACVFLFLRRRKFKLHRLDTKLRFGFLYNGYRESTYYWEFIVMIRKLIIICLTVFLTTETIEIQTASCASVFAAFYYIQNKYYPFEHENLNKTELSSNFVILITTWCGLFYTGHSLNIFADIIFFFFILSSNTYFIFMWTRTMIIELKLLSVEFFPFLMNFIEFDGLKIKKKRKKKRIFSLVNQDEDAEIIKQSRNRIKSSVDLSIFKIIENIKLKEEQKNELSGDSSEELSEFGSFKSSYIEEVI